MITYFIAKYVDDLTRNEPDNVGIVACDGERIVARFDGENDAGHIDLRKVRHRITGSHAYRAWVHYWREAIKNPEAVGIGECGTPSDLLGELVATASRDFYLEQGGTILLDADERPLEETTRELYERLVREPDLPSPMSLQEKSRQALAAAGAPMEDDHRFKKQFLVELDVEGVSVEHEVSYAVMNGDWHYLQEMPFDPGKPRVSRKEASHCAFLFEHAEWTKDDSLILYDGSDMSEHSTELLKMLEGFAAVVDVDRTDDAAELLHASLKLDEH
ncbi:MAG: hypothetical protein WA862_04995 [Solirubrobacterales bacterium]